MKFSALALAVLGLFLLSLIWDGRLAEYIDLRQGILVFLTGLGCIILAQVVLSASGKRQSVVIGYEEQAENPDRRKDWRSGGILWLVIPLLINLLFR